MGKLGKEEIKEITKKLRKKYHVETIEYLGYRRFALVESHKKKEIIIETEGEMLYHTNYRCRLSDEEGNIIKLKGEYHKITTFVNGVAIVIIREVLGAVKTSIGLVPDIKEKEGLIDTRGNELLPCIYDYIGLGVDNFVKVKKDGKTKTTTLTEVIRGKFNWDTAIE